MSIKHPGEDQPGAIIKPEISHFTPEGVVFADGSVADPDVVLLGTGYLQKKSFLEDPGFLRVDPSASTNASVLDALVTNTRYIFPLYRHILSLDPRYPPTALAFIGLPTAIANCPSDIAQSLFAAHVIANPGILPPRAQLLHELAEYEDTVRARGLDPYINGHKMLNGKSSDYQDELVDFLLEKVHFRIYSTFHSLVSHRFVFTFRVQSPTLEGSLSRAGAGTSSITRTSSADGNALSRSARESHGLMVSGRKRNGRHSCGASTSGKNAGKTRTAFHLCGTWISLADHCPTFFNFTLHRHSAVYAILCFL